MRSFTALLAAGAIFAATPALAVTASFLSASAGSDGTVVTAADQLLQLDVELQEGGLVTFLAVSDSNDNGFIDFDAFVDLFSSFGINELSVSISGDDSVNFATLGTVSGAFSTATLNGAAGDRTLRIDFEGPEFVSATLGDTGFGGTDFRIGVPSVPATFFITFQAVPAPAALALFGLGVLGLAALRRR